ncbi:MAG: (2Fe-2S)-binding protein [Burkholderiaceae bacterium]|nr:(2Fe-2S)-binding protein [Burkholderiaceae bacterium]
MSNNLTAAIELTVNGTRVSRTVDCRKHLVDFLREDLGLTGSHLGCEHGVCGACTVRLDGRIVRGCLVLAARADGCQVETAENPQAGPVMKALQEAFIARNALQCGYCTSGMLLTAQELVQKRPQATRDEIRDWMSGNYCRCTGYHAIVDAVADVLAQQGADPGRQPDGEGRQESAS